MKRRKFIKTIADSTIKIGVVPSLVSLNFCSGQITTAYEPIAPITAPFDMPQLQRPVFPRKVFNIKDFGASGDGITKNSKAFASAIQACSAKGGGTVLVPPGKWFTGAIHLLSNVNFQMEEGAEIYFSDNPEDYLPVVFTRWAGFELMNYSPFIYANNCENIAITGPGKLFGNGKNWWKWKEREDGPDGMGMRIYNEMVLKSIPPEKRIMGHPDLGLRPQFISPVNCRNVLLEGFSIEESGPFWTIQFIYCENVIARKLNLSVNTGPNNDGINMDSTRYALIENCRINSRDDAIAIKSGVNEDGRRVGRPSENIVVRNINCAPSNGSIAIGSEMSGDVRNIFFHDILISDTRRGIRIKSNSSRGGIAENIYFHNLDMKNIRNGALEIDTEYFAWMSDVNGKEHPLIKNIEVKNITCTGAAFAALVKGKEEMPVEDIRIENFKVVAERGMSFNWVKGLGLRNIDVKVEKGEIISLLNCENVMTDG